MKLFNSKTNRLILALTSLLASGIMVQSASAQTYDPILRGLGQTGDDSLDFGNLTLERNDDGSSTQLNLPFGINFFGNTYNKFYINNNGNITFNSTLGGYTPIEFPITNQPMIAPFWADVDTRCSTCGEVYLADPNPDTIVVTWDSVGYYSNNSDKTNTFQLVLRNLPSTEQIGDFVTEFRYGNLEWTTGDASDGTNGLGGTPAQAGYDAGNQQDFFIVPGSFTDEVLELDDISNVSPETPGFWSFLFSDGLPPGSTPDNPLLPTVTEEGFNFVFGLTDPPKTIWIDPLVAVGYNYIVNSGPNVRAVQIASNLGDGLYDIFFPDNNNGYVDSGFNIGINQFFDFTANGFANGVSRFSIRGIEESALVNPTNPLAFVTGLDFVSPGVVNLNQNPIVVNTDPNPNPTDVPEPSATLALAGLLGLGLLSRRQSRK